MSRNATAGCAQQLSPWTILASPVSCGFAHLMPVSLVASSSVSRCHSVHLFENNDVIEIFVLPYI